MKKTLFWYHWLTNKSFRNWVYMHDVQKYVDDIEQRRKEMLEPTSKMMYNKLNDIT